MTVKQTAVRLEVSAATIYALVAAGKLRCSRVGFGRGVIRISEEHLTDYLKAAEPVTLLPPAPKKHFRLRHLDI